MIHFDPIPHDEAAKIIASKPVATRAVFDALPAELRARTFVISGVEDLNVVQQIKDAISKVPLGEKWEDAKEKIIQDLGPWFDPEAANERAILLLRHHGFQAYSSAHFQLLDVQREAFPYWKYLSVRDERVRDSHAALHGLILPADDAFWATHYPPWDWGCRCQVVGVTAEEYGEAVDAGRMAGARELTEENKAQGWTLQDNARNLLSTTGRLDDGSGVASDVRAPVQRAQTPEDRKAAYQWHPKDMHIDLDAIRIRYDPNVFKLFEKQMASLQFGDGRTVLEWLGGKPPIDRTFAQMEKLFGAPLATQLLKESKWILPEANEVFVVLDKAGKRVFAPFKSGPTGGAIPSAWSGNMKDHTFYHQHPSGLKPARMGYGSSFSPPDILTACRNGVGAIIADSPKRMYVMRPGISGIWPSERKLYEEYGKAETRLFTRTLVGKRASRLTKDEVEMLGFDLIWKNVAKKMNLDYSVIKK